MGISVLLPTQILEGFIIFVWYYIAYHTPLNKCNLKLLKFIIINYQILTLNISNLESGLRYIISLLANLSP